MVSVFEKIKNLARSQGKSLTKVEEDLGYSRNYLYTLKSKTVKSDRLAEIADYFGVSADYLLGRTNNPATNRDENTELDFRELAKGVMLFDGKKLTEDDIDFLSTVLEAHLKTKRD